MHILIKKNYKGAFIAKEMWKLSKENKDQERGNMN